MSFTARLVIVALQIAAIASIFSTAPIVVATPTPLPLSSAGSKASHAPNLAAGHSRLPSNQSAHSNHASKVVSAKHTTDLHNGSDKADALKPRSDAYAKAQSYYTEAKGHRERYMDMAARSSSVPDDDAKFQRACAEELGGFHTSILNLQLVLKELGRDKGLANYDRNNDLETLLKDVVNFHKDILSATTVLVYNIPVLGPILGPIVYEIKCIVELLLDAVENLTDAIINNLQPLLKALLPEYTEAICGSNGGNGLCI